MSQIKDSIWEQNEEGKWNLYFNIKPFCQPEKNKTQSSQLESKKTLLQPNSLILGTQVMSPLGLGRLIKIEKDFGYVILNKDSLEQKFDLNLLSSDFYCYINFIRKQDNEELIRIKVKSSGKVEDILTQLEKINKINLDENNYSLYLNGKQLKEEENFMNIKIKNNCKILILEEGNVTKHTVIRLLKPRLSWSMNPIDGISFCTSKNIRLCGVGIYGAVERVRTFKAMIKVLEGDAIGGKVIYEEIVEVEGAESQINSLKPVYFSKGVHLKCNTFYTVEMNPKQYPSTYYGDTGKKTSEGDNGVVFTFKRTQGVKNGETCEEFGNFGEFYYYS